MLTKPDVVGATACTERNTPNPNCTKSVRSRKFQRWALNLLPLNAPVGLRMRWRPVAVLESVSRMRLGVTGQVDDELPVVKTKSRIAVPLMLPVTAQIVPL